MAAYKIIRVADRGRYIVARGNGSLWIHSANSLQAETFFEQCDDNAENRYLYSSANPHDNMTDMTVHVEDFHSLGDIKTWIVKERGLGNFSEI